ncbi:MAG: hypothetical protein HY553_10675 [Elusimicrobia bacterium]|nr:hypothetical protein [Elusimicrobiota bacterium]
MTKLQLATLRQRVRDLKGRRGTLERVAMQHPPMLAAYLLERRLRPGAPPAHYLSIPHPKSSRHRYVRKAQVEQIRRQTDAWREFSQAMAEWVRVNGEIERLLRRIGKGRCREIDLTPRR